METFYIKNIFMGPNSVFLVPIITSLGAFAMIFGIVYLKTRENMAMIEKGINPKQHPNLSAPFRSLKIGLLFVGSGVGLLIAYFIDKNTQESDSIPAIYFSLIAIGGGIGLIISYMIEKKELTRKRGDVQSDSV
jgi:hypothetical protein